MKNLQEQDKKTFCYKTLLWPFTVWMNCSSDLKKFATSRPSASNFKSFSRSLEQLFLTVGRINFGNKISLTKELDVNVKNSHFVTNIVIWSEYIFWFTYVLRHIKKCLLSITSAKISEKTNKFLFLRKTLITYVSRNSYTSSMFSVSNIKYLFLETERNLKAAKNDAVVRSNVKIIPVVKNSRKGHKI